MRLRQSSRASAIALPVALAGLAAGAVAVPARLHAQMPGLPVLQNGFASPGTSLALNFGTAGSDGRTYAGAASWGPQSRRFQLSIGLGAFTAGGDSWAAYGLRASVPVASFAQEAVGVAVFGGLGGARRDSLSFARVPLGAGVGWRRSLGGERGISVYGAPFFAWSRASVSGHASERVGAFRISAGLDLAVTRTFGVTLGYEAGASGDDDAPGGSGGLFGLGATYAFR